MKVALVHDFLLQYGGAERVLEEFVAMFPGAVIYTLCFDVVAFPEKWKKFTIIPVARRLPFIERYPQLYAPYLVARMHSIDFSEFDVVISSDTIFAKMIIRGEKTKHICYSYSPADMLYHFLPQRKKRSTLQTIFTGMQKSFLRREDYFSAQLPDKIIVLSCHVGARVQKYYRRAYEVIYPPVILSQQTEYLSSQGEYYLLVSRLVPNKHIDLAVKCCTEHGIPLIIVGKGSELATLQSYAGITVTFVTDADDAKRNELYCHCRGVLLCNEEDFGITPVEGMSYGKGVIGLGIGGILETVIPQVTGVFFAEQSSESLYGAIKEFERLLIDPYVCRKQAEKFSRTTFIAAIKRVIDEVNVKRVV